MKKMTQDFMQAIAKNIISLSILDKTKSKIFFKIFYKIKILLSI